MIHILSRCKNNQWHGDGGVRLFGEEWRQIRRVESRQVVFKMPIHLVPYSLTLFFMGPAF